MLHAIVSDIHANLVAWKAVLTDLAACHAGKIICLGDIVGYGPEPTAVLESVYRHVDAFVMGNHDAAVAGKMSPDNFNSHARQMVEWSAARISGHGREFLGSNPLTISAPGFVCAHGSPSRPQAFPYIVDSDEALEAWGATDAPLMFVGHSHIPGICVVGESGTPHWLAPQDFVVEQGKRFIVNAGSVGDPRDGDPRASYCLYDDETQAVKFRRVSFDYDALAEAVAKAGLDPAKMPMLRRDPVPTREAVRDALGFAPPTDEADMAQGVTLAADLDSLERSNRRLKTAVSVGAAVLACAAAISFAAIRYAKTASNEASQAIAAARVAHGVAVPEDPLEPRIARAALSPTRNLLPEFTILDVLPHPQLLDWRYIMEDPEEQKLEVVSEGGKHGAFLRIRHSKRHAVTLEAPEWIAGEFAEGRRAAVSLYSRQLGNFKGTAVISVVARDSENRERSLISKPFLDNPNKTWGQATRMTQENPIKPGSLRLSYSIKADFEGVLEISDPSFNIVE